jgi:hypothetical protein
MDVALPDDKDSDPVEALFQQVVQRMKEVNPIPGKCRRPVGFGHDLRLVFW